MLNSKSIKLAAVLLTIFAVSACQNQTRVEFAPWFKDRVRQVVTPKNMHYGEAAPKSKEEPSSVVVCRTQQCAPARLNMSKEFLYNSLLQLFDNNNNTRALICRADERSRTCLENYISLPIKVGVTPAYMYMDSVKIVDIKLRKDRTALDLIMDYNISYNDVRPECTPAKSTLFARSTDHILLEDTGYQCNMTSIGKTLISTVFAIDYIDLDYGLIGGYYSVGLSGPAYGGGSGYMLLRLQKDAYPIKPRLVDPKAIGGNARRGYMPKKPAKKSNRKVKTVTQKKPTQGYTVHPLPRK